MLLDDLYKKYAFADLDWDEIKGKFILYTNFLSELEIDYDAYHVGGVSHLYGLWCLASRCIELSISAKDIKRKLHKFYSEIRNKQITNKNVNNYKISMSARTKDKGQRTKRVDAIANYLSI